MALQGPVKVRASFRPPISGSTDVGESERNELVSLTVRVRPRGPREDLMRTVKTLASQSPRHRQYLSREKHAELHGADPADLEEVKKFASKHGLAVTDSSVARRTVHLLGTVEAVQQAFGVNLRSYRHKDLTYRGHAEEASVPAELGPVVEAIVGFDTRPHARPHFRIAQAKGAAAVAPHAAPTSFNPNDLATIYDFPDGDGTGQVIGIIELHFPHGSGFRMQELQKYFNGLGLPTPEIVTVSVDGGHNQPGTDPSDPGCADGEVMLDIEVVGAIAPKAKLVVCFAPNTGQGFLDVINKAVHDSDHKPTVISLSYGAAEDPTDPTTDQINQILQDAAALGVSFCVASGDSGSRDDPNNPNRASVDVPSSSPFSLACGGTTITVSGTTIDQEVVWEDHSGGGVSRHFDLPSYQENANVPMAANPAGPVRRGVPDVAGDGDPATGYNILVDGQSLIFGGTSAVAPLWSGLIARINQNLGHAVGFINQLIYQKPEPVNDIISGSNIDYDASAGWDPCTGLGSPKGKDVQKALT
jgi:kumamolisin